MAKEIDKQSKLQNAMSRAKKLIQLEANGTLDKIANGARDAINESLDGASTTQELLTIPKKKNISMPSIGGEMGPNAMNVPTAIRESFSKMPITDSDLQSAFGGGKGSIDDLSFLMENIGETLQKKPTVSQQTANVSQLVSEGLTHQQQGIDYPMIRTIVEEIVRKYSISLKNKIINESKSSNELNTITIGKSFKFLDSKGNIYECSMKKIGNINDKKRAL